MSSYSRIPLTKENSIALAALLVGCLGAIFTFCGWRFPMSNNSVTNNFKTQINLNSKAQIIVDSSTIVINQIAHNVNDTINNRTIGYISNIVNNDTAIKSAINVISNNGKDVTLDFYNDINFKHPYFALGLNKYSVGQYTISNSESQKAIIELFQSFYMEFQKKFSSANSQIAIEVDGSADGIPVFKGSRYEGDLGDLDVSYFSIDEGISKSVHLQKGITPLSNEIYALLRAYVIKSALEQTFPGLKDKIILKTKTYHEIGPQFRSVDIRLSLDNEALKQNFKLN